MSRPQLHVLHAPESRAQVLVIEDHTLPVVRMVVALRRGSEEDPEQRSGLSYTVMEMLTRGTQKRDRTKFSNRLEELGSDVQAHVGRDFALLRTLSLKTNMEESFHLLCEAVLEPAFNAAELTRFLEETVHDIRQARDDDDSLADIFLRRSLYEGHLFARASAGEIPDLRRIEVGDLHNAHARMLGAGRVVLAFAGDISPERALKLSQPLLQTLPRNPTAQETVVDPRREETLRITVVDKAERTQSQIRIARLGCTGDDVEAIPFWIGSTAFGGTFTSPFSQQIREERGWSYIAHSEFDRMRRYPAPFVLTTAPAMSDAISCLALELAMYREVAQGSLDSNAIEQARSYLLNRFPFSLATAQDILGPALRSVILGHDPKELWCIPEHLTEIDAEQVRSALRKYLEPDLATVVIVATASEIVDEVAKNFPRAQLRVVDYREGLEEEVL